MAHWQDSSTVIHHKEPHRLTMAPEGAMADLVVVMVGFRLGAAALLMREDSVVEPVEAVEEPVAAVLEAVALVEAVLVAVEVSAEPVVVASELPEVMSRPPQR